MKEELLEAISEKGLNIGDYEDSFDLIGDLEYDGTMHEIIDSKIDIYNQDLLNWASSLENLGYINNAVDKGLVVSNDFIGMIQGGQYVYYSQEAYALMDEIYNEAKSKGA